MIINMMYLTASDFCPKSCMLVFPEESVQDLTKSCTFIILDDEEVEETESFYVSAVITSGEASILLSKSLATVNIIDNDNGKSIFTCCVESNRN